MSPSAPARIRVALVEDDPGIRGDVAALFRLQTDMEWVADFGSARAALRDLPALSPDVVVMDLYLADGSGVDCVRRLKALLPSCEFMMLTVADDQALIFEALEAGATGYLSKGESSHRLCDSVRELAAGGSPMSASIARKIIQRFKGSQVRGGVTRPLSLREQEILQKLSAGLRYKEIAAELGLSVHTVRTHLHNVYEKLQVNSKADAIRAYRGLDGD